MSCGHFLKTWVWKSLGLWYKNRWWCWDPAVPVGRNCCWAARCLSFFSSKTWQEDCLEVFYPTGTSVDLLWLFPQDLMTLLNSKILCSPIWSRAVFPVSALTEVFWVWLIFEAHRVCENRVCLKQVFLLFVVCWSFVVIFYYEVQVLMLCIFSHLKTVWS